MEPPTNRGRFTKQTPQADGRIRGGIPFGRGPLFHLLRNRLYIGEIRHRAESYRGQHPAIIERPLFEAVQHRLDAQRRRLGPGKVPLSPAALTGRIFDANDQPMSPTHSYGKSGRAYRYYVSAALQRGQSPADCKGQPRRIAAAPLETHLAARLSALLPDRTVHAGTALALIRRIVVQRDRLVITLPPTCRSALPSLLGPGDVELPVDVGQTAIKVRLAFSFDTLRGRTEIRPGDRIVVMPDRHLVRALRAAHALVARDREGLPTLDAAPAHPYHHSMIRLAFLSPALQKAILEGRQPAGLCVGDLLDEDLPLLWCEQERRFGLKA